MLKQPNLSARIGVTSLSGGAGAHFKPTKPVSQDWGKVAVPGWCWGPFKSKQPNLARMGVKSLSGSAGAILKQPNLSARIGVKLLSGGAGAMLKQPNLSARIGKVGVPGWCWRPCL